MMLNRDQDGESTCYYQDGIPLCTCELFKQTFEISMGCTHYTYVFAKLFSTLACSP